MVKDEDLMAIERLRQALEAQRDRAIEQCLLVEEEATCQEAAGHVITAKVATDREIKQTIAIVTYRSALEAIRDVDTIRGNEYTVERMDYVRTIAWIKELAATVLDKMEDKDG